MLFRKLTNLSDEGGAGTFQGAGNRNNNCHIPWPFICHMRAGEGSKNSPQDKRDGEATGFSLLPDLSTSSGAQAGSMSFVKAFAEG